MFCEKVISSVEGKLFFFFGKSVAGDRRVAMTKVLLLLLLLPFLRKGIPYSPLLLLPAYVWTHSFGGFPMPVYLYVRGSGMYYVG